MYNVVLVSGIQQNDPVIHFILVTFLVAPSAATPAVRRINLVGGGHKHLVHNSGHGQKRQRHPTPVLLPGKSMDGGAWWAAVHGVAKSRTRLSDFTFTFYFHAFEKEMATHSSVVAWRIPGTGEPGGLLSMGLHRVGHG